MLNDFQKEDSLIWGRKEGWWVHYVLGLSLWVRIRELSLCVSIKELACLVNTFTDGGFKIEKSRLCVLLKQSTLTSPPGPSSHLHSSKRNFFIIELSDLGKVEELLRVCTWLQINNKPRSNHILTSKLRLSLLLVGWIDQKKVITCGTDCDKKKFSPFPLVCLLRT